jgi:hypothetical protein
MAAAAPPLITAYAGASAASKASLEAVFTTLYRAVVVGMWQTLETIPAAVWLLGNAALARLRGPRWLFIVLVVIGVINAAIAVYRLAA